MSDSSPEDSSASSASSASSRDEPQDDCPTPDDVPPTWVEWSVKIVSLGLVLGLLGYVVYQAASEGRPPTFSFTVIGDEVRLDGEAFVTPVEVTNEGTRGVSRLVFEARQGGAPKTLDLAVLGPGETRTVAIWLPADPRTTLPTFEAVSFVE